MTFIPELFFASLFFSIFAIALGFAVLFALGLFSVAAYERAIKRG